MSHNENPHHLILGKLTDFITGKIVSDTHDERYRQKIGQWLVNEGGFLKKDISNNVPLVVAADKRKASLKIDFIVSYENRKVIFIKYAPGSLVTRRLSTLALSRVISPYQIPYVVITNGQSAEILDGDTGKMIAQGLENLPDSQTIKNQWSRFSFKPIEPNIFEKASRIAYACEIDGACPCDTDICVID